MTRPALTHAHPQWAPPPDEPYAPQEDWSEVVIGKMRIVRSRRRARALKRRGVSMWFDSHERVWMWFIELTAAEHAAREKRTKEESILCL